MLRQQIELLVQRFQALFGNIIRHRIVDADLQVLQPCLIQLFDALFGQQESVGDHAGDHPALPDMPDVFIQLRVQERLAAADGDDFSQPVAVEEMKKRLDLLADMGTSIITTSGGEPLLHPELDEIIRHIRRRGMIAGMITNGFLLTEERIEQLNHAGLEHLQISIDNTMPDDVSKKSLKTLDQKLNLLAKHAYFQVNINSVLGSGVKDPEDA